VLVIDPRSMLLMHLVEQSLDLLIIVVKPILVLSSNKAESAFGSIQNTCHASSTFAAALLLKSPTQCKDDISHAFRTAKITVFDPMMLKSPDVPL